MFPLNVMLTFIAMGITGLISTIVMGIMAMYIYDKVDFESWFNKKQPKAIHIVMNKITVDEK